MSVTLKDVLNVLVVVFNWWACELASFLPSRLRRAARRDRNGFVLELRRSDSVLLKRTADGERSLGHIAIEAPDYTERLDAFLLHVRQLNVTLTIRMSSALGLRRILTLPLVAVDDIDQLLRFEMDGLTPFEPSEIYYSHRISRIDHEKRQVMVELNVAPKSMVDWALERARQSGVVVARIELAKLPSENWEPLNLRSGSCCEVALKSGMNWPPAILVVGLALVASTIPLQQRLASASRLEAQVTALRAEAEASVALRERGDQFIRKVRFLETTKTQRVTVTEVMAELTRLLPDGVHLVRVNVRDGMIQLYGRAADASNIIIMLDKSSIFSNPRFVSPITKTPDSGLEQFHVSIELSENEGG